jgi:ADP-dependent NAD(P)H-hydrate dehydratase / NAD(P)H-hydrate epimerase
VIQGTKVVTCEEMRRLEKLCFAEGLTAEELMDHAAESLLSVITDWVELSGAPQEVVLLVGKGNKGGDALSVGTLLLGQNFRVSAILVYPLSDLNSVCKARLERFKEAGGSIHPLHMEKIVSTSLIIDGIVGTGFQGRPDEAITHAITWANAQDAPILAIDIPSGLDGSLGTVETVCIDATITCCLGLPKIGCFIGQGWDYVGALLTCDINIPPEIVSHAQSTALLLKKESLELPQIVRTRHKYEAGYVLGISGSLEMPGAAALSSLATLRSGAGIVRLFTQPETSPFNFAPEVIRETIDLKRIEEEQERADSIYIGPGLGRSLHIQKMLQKLLPLLKKPTVVDGDGLYHLASISKFSLPMGSILTPHHGEMTRLLGGPPTLDSCQQWVEKHEVTVILKGAPTILFHPKRHPLIVTFGDPGMATAGSGDVLTGMVAALLAQKMPPDRAAPLAVYLHGRAGEIAAEKRTSYSMIASDLIKYLPKAFAELS